MAPRSSLFRRAARFEASRREDRLTEAFAMLLERVDGLARRLAEEWLSPDQRHAGERPGDGLEPFALKPART